MQIVIGRDDAGVSGEQAELIIKAVAAAMVHCGFTDAAVDITITDNKTIQQINSEYRGIDKATDCLSFPQYEGSEIAAYDKNKPIFLGDIVISPEKAAAQATEYGHTTERELAFLAVHSALHLLGYDHNTAEAEAVMRSLQRDILGETGYNAR